MAHGAGLAGKPAALDSAPDVVLGATVGSHQGLVDDHAQHRPGEIDLALAAVDGDPTQSRFDPDPGHGVLALAGGIGTALGIDVGLYFAAGLRLCHDGLVLGLALALGLAGLACASGLWLSFVYDEPWGMSPMKMRGAGPVA